MARVVATSQSSKTIFQKSLAERIAILVVVAAPFLAVFYAMAMLWQRQVMVVDVVLMVGLYILSGLGITVGFHRMLTHKSFETTPFVKSVLLVLGCFALEGAPRIWASTHIQHHAHSDDEDDPHSPMEGLWHSHVGWLFGHSGNPDVYGTWLKKDPVVMRISRTWLFWAILGIVIPTVIAGWSGFIWGGLVRIFLTHHITWSVNSLCHTFGNRPYETRDASRNNWLVGVFAFGEGWHNNHHAFPRSAYHGLRWWQVDISAYLIRAMEAVGLVWNVQRVKEENERKRRAAPAPRQEAVWDVDVQS